MIKMDTLHWLGRPKRAWIDPRRIDRYVHSGSNPGTSVRLWRREDMETIYRHRLIRTAAAALALQRGDGSMPAGRNNTWNDADTPVRCTSHFTVTLVHAFRWTGDDRYLGCARRCLEWLCSETARPYDATFLCRESRRKNRCNGLIGQAWALEALLHGYEVLGDPRYLELAVRVFRMHPLDRDVGLFRIREVDGNLRNLALTLNHQLIFTAQGMWLAAHGHDAIRADVDIVLRKLPHTMMQSRSGLIEHHVRRGRNDLSRTAFDLVLAPYRRRIRARSQGYQSFNMFALALAKRHRPDAPAWRNPDLQHRLTMMHEYATDDAFLEAVLSNDFALAYRLTGPEVLLFQREFGMSAAGEQLARLVEAQFEGHWNESDGLLNRDTGDPATLSSRIYEMCYLFEDDGDLR